MYLFVAIIFKPHAEGDGQREREKKRGEGGREGERERYLDNRNQASPSHVGEALMYILM